MKFWKLLLSLTLTISANVVSAQEIQWIWASQPAKSKQSVAFRRVFEVPAHVTSATWVSSADDQHKVWLNGKLILEKNGWQQAASVDISSKLNLGSSNLIAVEAKNDGGAAGFAGSLAMNIKGNRIVQMFTDKNWAVYDGLPDGWTTSDFDSKSWGNAVVVAPMGKEPWGNIIDAKPKNTRPVRATDPTEYKVAAGFTLEKIYDVPQDQGSWVSITPFIDNTYLCADQYGKIFHVKFNAEREMVVLPSDLKSAGAHGLLWHRNTLYVTVNESVGGEPGVYKVDYTNGKWGDPKLLKAAKGRSEHGPHSLVASPDGEWIYFIAGNHTDVLQYDKSMPATTWQEDQLVPRKPDPRGHAASRMAPGGYVARFRPDGSNWELVSIGFRNAFDIAFNLEGDLFAYDADMEWDFGLPWYRPTRINHLVAGSEFGWRNGSGKWPSYYEDSHGSVVDIGPGCPTGLLSGKGAKFPEKYQRAIYALDWTFATLYAIHLQEDGSGYKGNVEEVVAGSGLPLTDAIIGHDGAMYFLTGGRKTKSAMWRLSYTGSESTQAAQPRKIGEKATIRRGIESLTSTQDAAKLPLIWENLSSMDRTMRYTARLALEKLPVPSWIDRLASEKDFWRLIHSSMALARLNSKDHSAQAWSALDRCEWVKMNDQQRLNWLRAAGLGIIRFGEPSKEIREMILKKVDAQFPATDAFLNRELCLLLSRLNAPGIVARTLDLMDRTVTTEIPNWAELASRNSSYGAKVKEMIANYPPIDNTWYAYCLRVVPGPWLPGQRARYLGWIGSAATRSGGESYIGYLQGIRDDSLANATNEERAVHPAQSLLKKADQFQNLPQPKGPGRNWTVADVEKLETQLTGRNLENGKKMFAACLCSACHVIGNEGGSAGPQLNALGGRFSVRDIAEAIIEPGKVVSDQYAMQEIVKNDGSITMAKVLEEKNEEISIALNVFDLSQVTKISKKDVKEIRDSPASPMPPALINRLNEDELKDLLAYLLGK